MNFKLLSDRHGAKTGVYPVKEVGVALFIFTFRVSSIFFPTEFRTSALTVDVRL